MNNFTTINFTEANFNEDSIVIVGRDSSNKYLKMKEIYENAFSDTRTVYFFDEAFDGEEYYPANPELGGIIKVHNNNLNGLKTILTGIVLGGRKNVTVMVNWNIKDLEESGYLSLLKSFLEDHKDSNLIMLVQSLDEVKDMDFDYVIGD